MTSTRLFIRALPSRFLPAIAVVVAGCASAESPPAGSAPASQTAAPATAGRAGLTIEVKGLKPNQGYVKIAVVDQAKNWGGSAKAIAAVSARVTGDTMRFGFENMPVGKMAIRLYQDENGNGELDTNMIGIPTEGFGFSGQPSSVGPPSFEAASFDVPAAGTLVTIEVR